MTRFALTFRLPIIVWQALFFLGPLLFMVAMSFFLVKNYRMEEAFELKNWDRMLTRGYVWDSYWYTLQMAFIATVSATVSVMVLELVPALVVLESVPALVAVLELVPVLVELESESVLVLE